MFEVSESLEDELIQKANEAGYFFENQVYAMLRHAYRPGSTGLENLEEHRDWLSQDSNLNSSLLVERVSDNILIGSKEDKTTESEIDSYVRISHDKSSIKCHFLIECKQLERYYPCLFRDNRLISPAFFVNRKVDIVQSLWEGINFGVSIALGWRGNVERPSEVQSVMGIPGLPNPASFDFTVQLDDSRSSVKSKSDNLDTYHRKLEEKAHLFTQNKMFNTKQWNHVLIPILVMPNPPILIDYLTANVEEDGSLIAADSVEVASQASINFASTQYWKRFATHIISTPDGLLHVIDSVADSVTGAKGEEFR